MLTSSIDAHFKEPLAVCAICGRQVDAGGCPVIAEVDGPVVESAAAGLRLDVVIGHGEQLVVCRECQPD